MTIHTLTSYVHRLCSLRFAACAATLILGLSGATPVARGQDNAREEAFVQGLDTVEWNQAHLALPDDSFSFARIRYDYGGKWDSDFPESDLNVSFRLQQLTSLEVNPEPPLIELTDPKLFQYPFIFMVNPHDGRRSGLPFDLLPDEGANLREYLLNGGFLWVDDFWSRGMWEHFQDVIADRVFPERKPRELGFDHAIFHNIFEMDKIPQVPSHDAWKGTEYEANPVKTYEVKMDPYDQDYLAVPRFMAYYDDDGRMCMLVNVNNDIADGWEEEGYAPWFFNAFSEKYCFPMAINVLFYVMTH